MRLNKVSGCSFVIGQIKTHNEMTCKWSFWLLQSKIYIFGSLRALIPGELFLKTYKKTVKRLVRIFVTTVASHICKTVLFLEPIKWDLKRNPSLAWGVRKNFRALSRSCKFSRACNQLRFPAQIYHTIRRFHSVANDYRFFVEFWSDWFMHLLLLKWLNLRSQCYFRAPSNKFCDT